MKILAGTLARILVGNSCGSLDGPWRDSWRVNPGGILTKILAGISLVKILAGNPSRNLDGNPGAKSLRVS